MLNLKIVIIFTVGFSLAAIFGYFSQRIKLSSTFGYLIAGYCIGPYSPGYVADHETAEQLAEIGVILMMFGVGLHFKWQDLSNVKHIAIPGAFGQTLVATLVGAAFIHYFMGWPIITGIIFGLAIGVASTVVLVRILNDHNLLHTPTGHLAVGWLIVEDVITVFALLLIPTFAAIYYGQNYSLSQLSLEIALALIKFILLAFIMFTVGKKLIAYLLSKVVGTQSHELFTLSILAVTFLVATGAALIFGTSIALGAFIAGMVIAQTNIRRQVSTNTMPMKDAFVVIFFLSAGMLFDPSSILRHFPLFLSIIAIILIIKPLTAYIIALLMNCSITKALTVAIALAQIGEFSFILTEEAMRYRIFPDTGFDIIVACALVSITLNPLLFKLIPKSKS